MKRNVGMSLTFFSQSFGHFSSQGSLSKTMKREFRPYSTARSLSFQYTWNKNVTGWQLPLSIPAQYGLQRTNSSAIGAILCQNRVRCFDKSFVVASLLLYTPTPILTANLSAISCNACKFGSATMRRKPILRHRYIRTPLLQNYRCCPSIHTMKMTC